MVLRLIVTNSVDEYEFIDALPDVESQCHSDCSAIRAADDVRSAYTQTVHDTRDHTGVRLYRIVEPSRFFGKAKTEQIDRDDMKPHISEHGRGRFPNIHRCCVAMDKNNDGVRRFAKFLIVDAGAVDLN